MGARIGQLSSSAELLSSFRRRSDPLETRVLHIRSYPRQGSALICSRVTRCAMRAGNLCGACAYNRGQLPQAPAARTTLAPGLSTTYHRMHLQLASTANELNGFFSSWSRVGRDRPPPRFSCIATFLFLSTTSCRLFSCE